MFEAVLKRFQRVSAGGGVHSGPGGGGGGTPIWNRRVCSSVILNLIPKGDHLGVAQANFRP